MNDIANAISIDTANSDGINMGDADERPDGPPKTALEKRERIFDMHCHLDRMSNADEVARDTALLGIDLFCTTVSPTEATAARERFIIFPSIYVGVGLHPRWVADGRCDKHSVEQTARLAGTSRFIGEIGLDFGTPYTSTAPEQVYAFESIIRACSAQPIEGRLLSLHAVRAVDETIDILQRHHLTRDAHCVFHWFSGTSDQLMRARNADCFFSIGEQMLKTKRGREYARQIPLNRILLETDAPKRFDGPCSAVEINRSLQATLKELALIRQMDELELGQTIARTSCALLG